MIFLWVSVANADNLALSIVDRTSGLAQVTVDKGDAVHLEVRVDSAAAVAGASFTVTYDSANLVLRAVNPVTSSFFKTFVNQGLLTPPTDPEYITVDNVDYYSPIVENLITGGVMIAGARFNNGTGSNVEIFTLHFQVKTNAIPGTYPISITPSIISNTAAGYDSNGEAIPMLVGISGTTYPVHTVTTSGANVVINPDDTDNDGIDDSWEINNVPAGTPAGTELTIFTASGDYDHDGYSDYQEYLNFINGILDPQGNPFEPTVRNAPHGTGYDPISIQAINLLLLGN